MENRHGFWQIPAPRLNNCAVLFTSTSQHRAFRCPRNVSCRKLGVGRREVRRALDVLEEEGRIWRKQGKGTFIGPAAPVEPLALQGLVQQTNLLEVMEARLQLEPGLARLALRATGKTSRSCSACWNASIRSARTTAI